MSDPWPPEPLTPREPFREERWRLVSPTGMPAICEVVQIETGFETRVSQGVDDIIATDLQPTVGRACQLAEMLRNQLLGQGFTKYWEGTRWRALCARLTPKLTPKRTN